MDVKARVSSGDELLNEKFTVPSIITTPNPLDFNTFTKPGIYYVGSRNADNTGNNFINNGPIDGWGTLLVSGTGGTLFQVFITDTEAKIYHRCYHAASDQWYSWAKLIDKKTVLDNAFPVGFSYITGASNATVPSFGTWDIRPFRQFISPTELNPNMRITLYLVRRMA